MAAYSRPKLSDLYTLRKSKLLENHTLDSGIYLYSPYMAVPPPRPPGFNPCPSLPSVGTEGKKCLNKPLF